MRSVREAASRAAGGFAIILVFVAVLAAACGGGTSGGTSGGSSGGGTSSGSSGASSGSSSGGSTQVSLSEFKITPADMTASVGSTLTIQNTGTVVHDLVIQNSSGATVARTSIIQPGASAQLQLPSSATAGSYTAFCDIPGHKTQGMVGTLTIS
jgi:plastocyanin